MRLIVRESWETLWDGGGITRRRREKTFLSREISN